MVAYKSLPQLEKVFKGQPTVPTGQVPTKVYETVTTYEQVPITQETQSNVQKAYDSMQKLIDRYNKSTNTLERTMLQKMINGLQKYITSQGYSVEVSQQKPSQQHILPIQRAFNAWRSLSSEERRNIKNLGLQRVFLISQILNKPEFFNKVAQQVTEKKVSQLQSEGYTLKKNPDGSYVVTQTPYEKQMWIDYEAWRKKSPVEQTIVRLGIYGTDFLVPAVRTAMTYGTSKTQEQKVKEEWAEIIYPQLKEAGEISEKGVIPAGTYIGTKLLTSPIGLYGAGRAVATVAKASPLLAFTGVSVVGTKVAYETGEQAAKMAYYGAKPYQWATLSASIVTPLIFSIGAKPFGKTKTIQKPVIAEIQKEVSIEVGKPISPPSIDIIPTTKPVSIKPYVKPILEEPSRISAAKRFQKIRQSMEERKPIESYTPKIEKIPQVTLEGTPFQPKISSRLSKAQKIMEEGSIKARFGYIKEPLLELIYKPELERKTYADEFLESYWEQQYRLSQQKKVKVPSIAEKQFKSYYPITIPFKISEQIQPSIQLEIPSLKIGTIQPQLQIKSIQLKQMKGLKQTKIQIQKQVKVQKQKLKQQLLKTMQMEKQPKEEITRISKEIEEKKKQKEYKQSYDVYAKKDATKSAKWIKLNTKPQTYQSALGLGAKATDETISRTFKVTPSRGTPRDDYSNEWSSRGYKFRKHKKPKEGQFVEKTSFAIDTKGEKEELDIARWKKQQKPVAFQRSKSSGIIQPMKFQTSYKPFKMEMIKI